MFFRKTKVNKFFVVFGAIFFLLLSGCFIESLPGVDDGDPVDPSNIQGVTRPVAGEIPVETITETDQFTGTVTWEPSHSPFQADTVYTASITLTARPGFTVQGEDFDPFYFYVPHATSSHYNVGTRVITAVFPATEETVTLSAIPGLTVPVGGATPVTVIDAAQYSGTVTWTPAITVMPPAFAGDVAYTATVTFAARSGFTFFGTDENFFTVEGATTVTSAANSNVVTAVFPATALAPVSITAIGGVTPPSMGATPVTTVTETAQFTGTVTWAPLVSGTFAGLTAYTATITLTARAGYTLDGVAANAFTVVGASSVSNAADSGVVTAVFPQTGDTVSLPVTILAIPGVPAPVRGQPPTLTVDTEQYTGTVSWEPFVAGTFTSGRQYTATITLTAKEGFTFYGVAANAFTVAGASSVSNAVDSGVVTAEFPQTQLVSGTQTGIAHGWAIIHPLYGEPDKEPVSVTVTMLDSVITNIVVDKGDDSLDFITPVIRNLMSLVQFRNGLFDLERRNPYGDDEPIHTTTYVFGTNVIVDTSHLNDDPQWPNMDVGAGATWSFNAIMRAGREAVRLIEESN